MCTYRVTLAVMNGHQPNPVRRRTMQVRADGPLEAARRAEDLCNVLLDRTSGPDLWAQVNGIERMAERPEPEDFDPPPAPAFAMAC